MILQKEVLDTVLKSKVVLSKYLRINLSKFFEEPPSAVKTICESSSTVKKNTFILLLRLSPNWWSIFPPRAPSTETKDQTKHFSSNQKSHLNLSCCNIFYKEFPFLQDSGSEQQKAKPGLHDSQPEEKKLDSNLFRPLQILHNPDKMKLIG